MSGDSEIDAPIVPYLIVHDAHSAIAFYKAAFDATADIWPHPDGQRVAHAALNINGGMVYLSDEFPENTKGPKSPQTAGAATSTTVLNVDNADAWFARAIAAGATVNHPLKDEFYGRHGQLRDPFGHLWGILGPIVHPTDSETTK